MDAARVSTPHRTAVELAGNGGEEVAVYGVEALVVHLQHGEGGVGNAGGDVAVAAHFGIVAHPPQQAIGDAWGAARAPRHLVSTLGVRGRTHLGGGGRDDARELIHGVEREPLNNAETGVERGREEPGPGRCANEREVGERQLHRARGWPFADQDVDGAVFHGGIEDFLHHGREPVNLVHEQHIAVLQMGEDGSEVAGTLQHGPRGGAQVHLHLVGNDVGKRGLAEARGAEDQRVVQRVAPASCRLDEYLHLVLDRFLPHIVGEAGWTQGAIDLAILAAGGPGGDAVRFQAHAAEPMRRKASRTSTSTVAPSCATSSMACAASVRR